LFGPAAVRAAQDPPPPADEVGALRQELAALRADYERRLADLEARLLALGTAPPQSPTEPAIPRARHRSPSWPPRRPRARRSSNPDIAVIGDFLGAAGRNRAPGAPPPLEMHEAEASFQAIVDPYARADFFLAFSPRAPR
jgi:hypothetical protein